MVDELTALRAERDLLRRQAELWRTAEEVLQLGVWEHHLASGASYCSEATRRLLDLDPGTPASREGFLAAVHPDDRERVDLMLRGTLEADSTKASLRYRIVRRSGEVRWLETSVRLERDAAGHSQLLVGISVDRTDTHHPEARQHAEARQPGGIEYEALAGQPSLAVFVADPRGRFVDVNRGACELLGYSRDDLLGMSIADVVPAEDVLASPLRFEELGSGKVVRTERRMRRKDGLLVPVEVSAQSLPDGRIHAVVFDMTERKEAAKALRESDQTLRELGSNIPALIWVRDLATGALLYANDAWIPLLGRAPVVGASYHQLGAVVHPDDLHLMTGGGERTRDSSFEAVVRLVDPQGVVMWFRVRTFSVRDASGTPYRVAGFAENVTAARRAEQALRDSEARYRSVVLAMSDGIVVHGPTGEIVTTNPSAERVLGLTADQIAGRTSLDPRWRAIREDGSPFPGEEHPGWVTVQTGRPLTGVVMGIHDPSGALRWISVNSRRVTEIGEEGAYSAVASFTDVTEQRAAEAKIRASLREKELLLKEIHHRVKNNLQVISSLLFMQSMTVDEPRVAKLLKESQDRIDSMTLIHDMLYQAPDLARIPFSSYARRLGESLARSYGVAPDKVALVVDPGEAVLGIDNAVPCGLLLNEILSNSLTHAYPAGKQGTIRVGLHVADNQYELCASDDGVGLPVDFEERASSSLGTKLIERLVEQLGGSLVRKSAENGTGYCITFRCDATESLAPRPTGGAA